MLIKAQMLEQRTCSDHQCDLGASIRTWASICRGCEAFFSLFFLWSQRVLMGLWGEMGLKDKKKRGERGKRRRRAGGLKSQPAFNFSQTALEVVSNALHIQRHVR